MCSLFNLVVGALSLYYWVLIVAAVMSWLTAFGVVNRHNRAVAMIDDMLYRVTEPALRPLRRMIPPLGGVDVSFIVLILLLIFVQNLLYEYLFRAACVY
ncbi:MAG: YggT family protein [Aliidongia sp.]|jgi:YggT family protein|nr:YggT family protein [Aliidongia sp.]